MCVYLVISVIRSAIYTTLHHHLYMKAQLPFGSHSLLKAVGEEVMCPDVIITYTHATGSCKERKDLSQIRRRLRAGNNANASSQKCTR
jgi:hypothetical protein